MTAGKHTFFVAILMLVSSLFGGRGSHVHHNAPQVVRASGIAYHSPLYHRHFVPVLTTGANSDESTRRGEKRHGKSLISHAIVADAPIVLRPDFTYRQHHYQLFLPPGYISQFFGHFSLRGPPALV